MTPSGSIYTVTGVSDPSRNGTGAIHVSQGTVAVGQWGYFLPSEYQVAIEDGFILVAGIVAGNRVVLNSLVFPVT